MNNKFILFLLLFFPLVAVSVEDVKNEAGINKTEFNKSGDDAFDYMSCSAFFAVMANNLTDKPEFSGRFNAMSEIMIDHAISLEDQDYSGNSADDMALKLMEKMQKGEDSAKYVIQQYAPYCKALLKKIMAKEEKSADSPKAN